MYERLYKGRAYLGKAEIEPVRREVAELRHRFAVGEPVRVPRPSGAVERSAGARGPSRRGAQREAEAQSRRRASSSAPGQLECAAAGARIGAAPAPARAAGRRSSPACRLTRAASPPTSRANPLQGCD